MAVSLEEFKRSMSQQNFDMSHMSNNTVKGQFQTFEHSCITLSTTGKSGKNITFLVYSSNCCVREKSFLCAVAPISYEFHCHLFFKDDKTQVGSATFMDMSNEKKLHHVWSNKRNLCSRDLCSWDSAPKIVTFACKKLFIDKIISDELYDACKIAFS